MSPRPHVFEFRTGFQRLPLGVQDAIRLVYHAGFRWQLRTKAVVLAAAEQIYVSVQRLFNRRRAPVPPPLLRYRVSEDLSITRFLRIGEASARNIEALMGRAGLGLGSCERVLDFGCGCGRTLRWLLDAYGTVAFYGSDVDQAAIAWNSQNLRAARFFSNKEWPRLPIVDSYFDAVYAISVFTHLDCAHQLAWAEELARVIRPGGVLVLTVHGHLLARSAGATDDELTAPMGVLYRRTRKLEGLHPDWYQTAYNAEAFTTDLFSRFFSDVEYVTEGFGYQDALLCRR